MIDLRTPCIRFNCFCVCLVSEVSKMLSETVTKIQKITKNSKYLTANTASRLTFNGRQYHVLFTSIKRHFYVTLLTGFKQKIQDYFLLKILRK